MQGKLEEMLMTVVQKFEVPPMELLKFVEYPFTVSDLYAHTCTHTHTHPSYMALIGVYKMHGQMRPH